MNPYGIAPHSSARACGLNVFLGMIAAMLLEIFEALADKAGKEAHRDTGARVFSRGEEVKSLFLLDAGEVKLTRPLLEDRELILQRTCGPAVLAEASLHREHYDCDAICLTACRIRSLPASRFLSLVEESAVLSSAWATYLAQSLEEARVRAEILTLKTARARLEAWIAWKGSEMLAQADRAALAAELGVSVGTLRQALKAVSRSE